ncbi:carboxypeptidase-like regulatory domain-containing protein [Aquimarina sp. 2304DJ70-9]|uniref:carboxypeptidase-like regulatory domain-containing protein n=1 Tax=Aquimarina penaris TaxID=3231044 RepID=UPI0034618DCB
MKKKYFTILILIYSLKSFAQTGSIQGNVMYLTDSINVPEVKILVIGTKVQIETFTDWSGHFKIDSLKPETYNVVAQKIGYLNDFTKSVSVKNDSITQLKLELNRRKNTSRICPVDKKSDEVIPIVYGLVSDIKSLMKATKGEIILAGCGISEYDPMWHCKKHNKSF